MLKEREAQIELKKLVDEMRAEQDHEVQAQFLNLQAEKDQKEHQLYLKKQAELDKLTMFHKKQ